MPAPRFPAFCGAAPRGAEDGVGCACRTGKRATSEQSPLCSDVFFAFGRLHLSQKSRRRTAPLLLFFRKRPRSARLFACKRSHNGSLSLPAFRGRRASRRGGWGGARVPHRKTRHVGASSVSLAPAFFILFQNPERAHAAAPPFPQKAPLGSPVRLQARSQRLAVATGLLRLPRLAARKDRPGHGAPEEAASHFQLPDKRGLKPRDIVLIIKQDQSTRLADKTREVRSRKCFSGNHNIILTRSGQREFVFPYVKAAIFVVCKESACPSFPRAGHFFSSAPLPRSSRFAAPLHATIAHGENRVQTVSVPQGRYARGAPARRPHGRKRRARGGGEAGAAGCPRPPCARHNRIRRA